MPCLNISLDIKLCLKCCNGYYEKENDNYSDEDGYVKCYKNPIGFYLDKNESIYKKCHYSCKECEISGDYITHNCLICDENYLYAINKSGYLNCYENCSHYHYFDDDNNYYCTFNSTCPDNYPILISENRECVKNDIFNISKSSEFINKELLSTDKIITNKELSSIIFNKESTNKELLSTIIFNKESNNKELLSTIFEKEIKITTVEIESKIKNNNIKNLIEELINNKTKHINKENEKEYYDTILESIEISFTSENYDSSDLDKGKIETIENGKLRVILGTSLNLKRNLDENITNIDLGECEILLKKYYNLTNNEILYIKLLEINQEGMKIPKIEYDVYCKLNGLNLLKLNISICKNSKMYLYVPVTTMDSLDKLNSNSRYYHDICYISTTESGTDITLKDRKKEFINKTVCQDDCDFSDYNYTSKKSKCLCNIKESSSSFVDIKINATKLLANMKNIKNYANVNILVCYKELFSKNSLLKNVGFYILCVVIITSIINMFIFYIKYSELLKNKIKDIINAKQYFNSLKRNKTKEEEKKEKDNICQKEIALDINKNDINNDNDIHIYRNKKRKKRKKKTNKSFKGKTKDNNKIINNKKRNSNIILFEKNSKSKDNNENENMKKIIDYNEYEINTLPYELAIQYDNRTYCEYYISLLRTKHNLILSFYYNKDYNSKIIKIDLFFIGFTIYYIVNALFYNDATMHNIYIKKGAFDIEYQLPKIIYSSLISIVLNTLLKYMALTNDGIIDFKQSKKKKGLMKLGEELYNKLRIKFVLFFILSFILLLFFWYYISMFCAIYRNTQYHLLKDTLISFGLSLLYPFGIYLLPGIFRISSLSKPKKKRECLYKFSKILQFF